MDKIGFEKYVFKIISIIFATCPWKNSIKTIPNVSQFKYH